MREKLKSPFRKLRDFALSKQGLKEEVSPGIGEGLLSDVAKCMQDVGDMRIKFEGLLANGQIISGAAYDFARSLQDMASYMMETFGEIVDEEIGNIFSLLAKVQFEMSKLLDLFAAHVSKTIIKPAETMMSKIQQAEIMKDQYDEKWKLYILSQIEKQKGKAKRGKANLVNHRHVRAKENIKEQANVLNLHMQSLVRGQSENLVTQAVKYHSAQMHLFSKGLASINAVEPMMRRLALDKIIDRTLPEEEISNSGYLSSMERDEEEKVLKNDSVTDSMASSPRHLSVEHIEPSRYSSESSEEILPMRAAVNSKSAPISPLMHHEREGTQNIQESSLESEHERMSMYALPFPSNGYGRWVGSRTDTKMSQKHVELHSRPAYYSGNVLSEASDDAVNNSLLHRQIKDEFVRMQQHEHFKMKGAPNKNLDLFAEGTRDDNSNNVSMEKSRKYSQSGPLINIPSTYSNSRCANARKTSSTAIHEEHTSPLYKSGPISRSPMYSYTSCNLSPPPLSMPQISELHKLPLPPPGLITPPKSPYHTPSPIAYSAPLGKIVQAVPSKSGRASPPAITTPQFDHEEFIYTCINNTCARYKERHVMVHRV